MVLSVVFSGYLCHNLGGAMPCPQIAQHFPPNTYAFLRAISVVPCGLIPRMYLCTTVDSTRDVGSDKWAISMPFDNLFNVSLASFRRFLASYQSARSGLLMKRRGRSRFNPDRRISGDDASLYFDSKRCFVKAI